MQVAAGEQTVNACTTTPIVRCGPPHREAHSIQASFRMESPVSKIREVPAHDRTSGAFSQ